jgi:hypothetical protein
MQVLTDEEIGAMHLVPFRDFARSVEAKVIAKLKNSTEGWKLVRIEGEGKTDQENQISECCN